MEKKGNGIFTLLLNVIFVFVIVIAGVITILSLNTKQDVASVMGYVPFSIQTPSMEKTIMTGDFIVTVDINKYDEELKVEDIISFKAIEQGQKIIKTHRIIEVKKDGNLISYVTKGDNNTLEDAVTVQPGDVVSVYTGMRVPFVGYGMDLFSSRYGFLFGIILPIFIFFIYQLYVFMELLVELKLEGKRAKNSQ
jgi:signal peptidase I